MGSITLMKVEVKVETDECPDLSYLGKYGNDDRPGAIDRKEQGDWNPRDYQYFYPAMTGEETGNPDSPMQDYRRMEDYGKTWNMAGVYATAEIVIKTDGHDWGTIQTIRSGGLWGIESDSRRDYIREEAETQLTELEDLLRELKVTLPGNWKTLRQEALDKAV